MKKRPTIEMKINTPDVQKAVRLGNKKPTRSKVRLIPIFLVVFAIFAVGATVVGVMILVERVFGVGLWSTGTDGDGDADVVEVVEVEVNDEVKVEEDDELTTQIKNEKYYLEKNLERYRAYAVEHPTLSPREVVRDVNSNLDHTRYVDVKQADLSYGVLSMINKYNYLGTYEPEDLVMLGEGYTSGVASMLRREVAEAFMRMADAARSEGLILINISGYRSYELQDYLYNNYVARDGQVLADTYSSRAGYSEHQAGLATDINSVEVSFEETPEFQWLQEHAAEHGFIMRYPDGLEEITGFSYEPWHYRYVGVEAAQQIVREGLTFDEYYAYYVEK